MAKGNNLSPTIDRLGVIAALMSDLKAEQAELKAVLVEHGPGAYEGERYPCNDFDVRARKPRHGSCARKAVAAVHHRAHHGYGGGDAPRVRTQRQQGKGAGMSVDFNVVNHGSVWTIRAVSPEAIAFAQDNFEVEGWMGLSENFTTDWRSAAALTERLAAEGWRVE